jgi:hypothetical protein
LRPGTQVEVKLQSAYIEIWHKGDCVARHERCYRRRQQILDLEHYLEVLRRKPGALAGSTPLVQWREQGRWKASHDRFWQILNHRQGRPNGTRAMIEVLTLGKQHGYDRLDQVLEIALELGCSDVDAIRYLLTEGALQRRPAEPVDAPLLARYERPLPTLTEYDQLLSTAKVSEVPL